MKNIMLPQKSDIYILLYLIFVVTIAIYGAFPQAFQLGNPYKAAQNYCSNKDNEMCEILDCSWISRRCDIREKEETIVHRTVTNRYDCRGSTCSH